MKSAVRKNVINMIRTINFISRLKLMDIISIVWPIDGIIGKISSGQITITNALTDNNYVTSKNNVYAIMDGVLSSVKTEVINDSYLVILTIKHYLLKSVTIKIRIDISKSRYNCMSVFKLAKKINGKVKKGEIIGTVNDMLDCEINFNAEKYHNNVSVGSKITGGKNTIACVMNAQNNNNGHQQSDNTFGLSDNTFGLSDNTFGLSDNTFGLSDNNSISKTNNYVGSAVTAEYPARGGLNSDDDNNIKKYVILTTPHEVCAEPKDHNCDLYANKLAKNLSDNLNKNNIMTLFHGNINRQTLDLNRVASYYSDFRYELRSKVYDIINNADSKVMTILYVLDCHSFPAKNKRYAPSFPNLRIDNPEAAIIFSNCSFLLIVEELSDTFRDNGIISTKFWSNGNSIIDEFDRIYEKYHNIIIVPILIEVREDLTDEKINLISKSVDQWINTTSKFINTQYKKKGYLFSPWMQSN
jgi:hypothetical protein